ADAEPGQGVAHPLTAVLMARYDQQAGISVEADGFCPLVLQRQGCEGCGCGGRRCRGNQTDAGQQCGQKDVQAHGWAPGDWLWQRGADQPRACIALLDSSSS